MARTKKTTTANPKFLSQDVTKQYKAVTGDKVIQAAIQGNNLLVLKNGEEFGYVVEYKMLSEAGNIGSVCATDVVEYEDGEIDPELPIFTQLRTFGVAALAN